MKKQKTLALRTETKEKFDNFKKFAFPKISHDDFLNYLMDSCPKMTEYIQADRDKTWKDEFIGANLVNPTISWEDFKKIKTKEALK